MSARRLLIASALVLLATAALSLVAGSASAVIYFNGDWTVSGVESYSNETIIINATSPSTGNLIVAVTGVLTLDNCRVVMPFNRTFDQGGILTMRNTTVDGPNYFLFLHGPSFIYDTDILNATHRSSGGFSGTYISDTDVHFHNVSWEATGNRPSAYRSAIIHVRVVMDLQHVHLGGGTELYYELAPIAGTAVIDISNITTDGYRSMGYTTTPISVTPVTHSGDVLYNIHDIYFLDALDGIDLRQSSNTTVYRLWNLTFEGTQSSSIEIGDTGDSRFGGQLQIDNMTSDTVGGFGGGTRAFRMYCNPAAQVSISRLTVTGGGRGVWVEGCATQVSDSVFSNSLAYHFVGDSNSHITIYRTDDNPALTTTSAGFGGPSNGIIEHMAFLNIVAITWQGGVAFNGDLLSLRNSTGAGNLDIDPTNWTPRFSVWWGRYGGSGLFDNRDLRPSVTDGTRTFPCAPNQFFFTETMGALSITCNDNWGPTMSVAFPRTNGVVNQSTFQASGSVVDLGSGLASVDWSFNNLTWNPITLPTNGTNWTATLSNVPDERYYLYTRATDRVGQSYYVSVGPFLVDTSPPGFTLPQPPEFVSGVNYTLDGFSEPQARMSYGTITGLSGNTTVNSAGEFTLVLPLTEGLNVFTITAVDQAGNRVTQVFSLVVDHTPPALTVFLDAVTYTASQTLVVEGLAEAGSTVVVNGVTASRTGEGFQLGVPLAPGPNNVVVSATDGAGNVRQWMGLAVYDNAAPDLSVVVSTGNQSTGGTHITSKATVPVAGQVTDALTSVAWLSINGIQYTFDGEGVFFIAVNVTEGTNTFTVMAQDLVGNTARFNFTVLRDSTAPTATVALGTGGGPIVMVDGIAHVADASVTLVVTMSEAGTVNLNGQPHNAVAGENNYIVTLAEGVNEFRFTFRDAAGTPGTGTTFVVFRDTSAPALSLSKPGQGEVIIGTTFLVEGTTEVGSSVFIDGEEVPVSASGAFSKSLPLANGTTSVTVEAYDALGNKADTVVSVTRGEAYVPPEAPQQDMTLSLLFLVVGLGAGAAVGFILRARSASAMRRELEDAEAGGPGPQPGQGPQPPAQPAQGPSAAEQIYGPPPKGPRGPQPPGPR